jgi:hypothetical protein
MKTCGFFAGHGLRDAEETPGQRTLPLPAFSTMSR